jgi:hypothetical protein
VTLNRASKIPDYLDEASLATHLAMRLAGTAAEGGALSISQPNIPAVIWVDRGDEVLVHLSSLRTQIRDGVLLISIDLETDQRGRTTLVLTLALGSEKDPAGLIAVTDELPRGDGIIASRWGKTVQEALWASLLTLALDHAKERSASPVGFSTAGGRLLLLRAGDAPIAAPPKRIYK